MVHFNPDIKEERIHDLQNVQGRKIYCQSTIKGIFALIICKGCFLQLETIPNQKIHDGHIPEIPLQDFIKLLGLDYYWHDSHAHQK
jgi:hypothetical protein